MGPLNIIWGLLLLLLVLVWMLTQTSPYFRERIDDAWESIEKWWAIDNDIPQSHLKDCHFKHMIDSTRCRRRTGPLMKRMPKHARPHPTDPNCYILHGEEFCR
jgi:hypothetical protein